MCYYTKISNITYHTKYFSIKISNIKDKLDQIEYF